MSRTDHHAPAWVRTLGSTTAVEHHSGCQHDGLPRPRFEGQLRECDIDTRDGRCYRWDRDHHGTWDLRPTNAMIATDCTAPERTYVRDLLRAALREYNAHGDTDIEPECRQRARATFGGCYFH